MFARMRSVAALAAALISLLVLLLVHLGTGPVPVSFREALHAVLGLPGVDRALVAVVRDVRIPSALTAMLVGAALASSGAVMQTLFSNPLAGPSVLGVSSGAGLGAALVMLVPGLSVTLGAAADAALVLAAFAGALLVLAVIVLADRRLGDPVTLLILGLMVGHLGGALVSVLEVAAGEGALRGFVLWGMGSFAGVGPERMPWLALPIAVGLFVTLVHMRALDAMLLGDEYARSMGVEVRATRTRLILATGLMAGACTAFCGPIAFIGLATPHLARALLRSAGHRLVLPGSALCGALLALACDILVRRVDGLPVNALTSLIGAPVVVWVLWSGRRWARMATG